MPMQIAGFAKGLVRCLDFDSVGAAELGSVLEARIETLKLDYAEPSATAPLIQSGSAFTHLVSVQHGTVAPWQSPHSELEAPFLIGVHEFLMETDRWVGSYSAITEAAIVRIPRSVMEAITAELPSVRERMHGLVMRRLARFYWVSLAASGPPMSRVAAALVSRLALEDLDFGGNQRFAIKQKDLARLTTLSRSAAAVGLAELAEAKVIAGRDGPGARFRREARVPDVDALRQQAFFDVRTREIGPLLAEHDDE